jgi:hypothetical protein
MHPIFSNGAIIKELLVRSQNNAAFALVNKFVYSIAKSNETKAKWIEYRKKELKIWISTFHLVMKDQRVFESFSDWLAYQTYPVHQDATTFGNLLSDDLVILQLLKNALESNEESLVEMYWDVLASRGSMAGLAFALKSKNLQDYFESNISMPTNAIYVCLSPSSPIDEGQSLDLLKFFAAFGPKETSLQEAFEYACITGKLSIAKHTLANAKFQTVLSCLVASKNFGWNQLERQIYTDLKIENKQEWDHLKKVLDLVENDKCYLVKSDILRIYEKYKGGHLFLECWTSCVGKAIVSSALNSLEFLFNIEQFPNSDLFVPLSLLCKAIDLGNDEVCEMVVQHLDCSDSKVEPLKKLQMILEEYCATSKRQLFSRLYPLPALCESHATSVAFIEAHQNKIVHFLVKILRKKESDFKVPSICLWKAFQVGNNEMTQTLQSLGGVANWLDTDGQGFIKLRADFSTDEDFVDDDRTGLFQAFGGNGTALNLNDRVIDGIREEDDVMMDADYSQTRRKSAEMLAEMIPPRRSSSTTGWTDYRMNRRQSAVSSNSVLGSKRVVLRSQETSRLVVPRKSSFANIESDRIWNSYFTANKNEIEKIFAATDRIEWMEPDSVEPKLNHGYNSNQEAPMVRDLSQLY